MRQRDRAEEGEIEEDVEAEEEVEEGKKGINGKRARQMGGGGTKWRSVIIGLRQKYSAQKEQEAQKTH